MNLQSIERLQNLLGRIEQNAKLPRTRTQGFGAFVGAPAPVAVESAPEPVAEAPESLPPDVYDIDVSESPEPPAAVAARAAEQPPLEDVSLEDISGVELEEPSAGEVLAAEPPIEDLEADEIAVEVTSDITSEAPSEPKAAPPPLAANAAPALDVNAAPALDANAAPALDANAAPALVATAAPPLAARAVPFTAPPDLDELTFSEPPPPAPEPAAAEVEAPPVSAAQAVSEPPDSIDAALLAASEAQAAAEEEEEEGPALTPPPESGPQVAVPPMAAPAVPAGLRDGVPTMEQLGDVIELEQASGPPLELAAPVSEPKPAASKTHEELEFVPRAPEPSRPLEAREVMPTLVGGFSEEFDTGEPGAPETPPPPARIFVPAVKAPPVAEVAPFSPIPQQPTQPMVPAGDVADFGDEAPTASSQLAPEVVARGPVVATRPVVDVIAVARAYRPQSFLELLDASIGLLK